MTGKNLRQSRLFDTQPNDTLALSDASTPIVHFFTSFSYSIPHYRIYSQSLKSE